VKESVTTPAKNREIRVALLAEPLIGPVMNINDRAIGVANLAPAAGSLEGPRTDGRPPGM